MIIKLHPMFDQIPIKDSLIQLVKETPRESVYKYSFNPASVSFHLDKILPVGQSFPFDFGFLPNTKGEDGDPLDVLILGDQPICQGRWYRQQIESFFIYYKQLAGKVFQPIGWESSANALTSLRKWSSVYKRDKTGV